jgi:hypothetical protein
MVTVYFIISIITIIANFIIIIANFIIIIANFIIIVIIIIIKFDAFTFEIIVNFDFKRVTNYVNLFANNFNFIITIKKFIYSIPITKN